ncbi:amino acid permease [Ectobacillus ponti]|uniref:Amino acid permease n=1 Tax=Ectobacillus ponti TaxID=2961894 RepID=A0AA41XBX5_9BACI|nr:amino acid permease [Ectobacillus ponti]MCP8969196.1 amino acid permease [Ectobacillus ponti]
MTCTTGNQQPQQKGLKWWQLSLLGIGCTIGTGFFLGSSLGIKLGGPSVIIAFILGGYGTYVVFEALAKMTVADPQQGSFRTYAKKAFGHGAGFGNGWVYWSSELLIMGSQLTGLGIFTRYWFPKVPLWMLASVYAVAGLLVIFIGFQAFEKLENGLAVLKILAIIAFISVAIAALFGWIDGGSYKPKLPTDMHALFPKGGNGLWASLLYAFYAYGGIEIMGLMTIRLTQPKDATKSGTVMLLILTVIYILSIGLAVSMVPWKEFNEKESPFVIALHDYHIPYVPFFFNAVLIMAGFSTMVGSLFAVTNVLMNLADDGDAPAFFSKKQNQQVSFPALLMTALGLVASIVVALLLPKTIYEYITTAAGLMLLYTWLLILLSFRKLLDLTIWDHIKSLSGLLLVGFAITGTLLQKETRPGLLVSLLFLVIIGLVTWRMSKVWKTKGKQLRKMK